ncbi:MAG: 3-hydroxyacyl-ACP dehydratase FabZ, partial [Albidovulum sp.]|nr:3-hydroxyacyl-ACP dehydratase FabZ [Albidovulum sp.]
MTETVDSSLPSADIGLIKRMIPHRYPFLLIDKVVNMVADKGALGIKNVTVNEPYFEGHFPSKPIMPGVSIIESMAQTAAVLVVYSMNMTDRELSVYLLSVDNARFRQMVVPGDIL